MSWMPYTTFQGWVLILSQAINGVPRLGEGINPATWMLEISTPGFEKKAGIDFAEIYAQSGLYRWAKF